MLNNIPAELRALKRWVSVSIEPNPSPNGKPLKIPYISGNCAKASSTNPNSWRSFEEALKDVTTGKRDHVGFVFAPEDPYVFIDLDDLTDPEQQKVFERVQTYSQRSVSGNGIHLICKGEFVGDGRHPSEPNAGMFQEGRYCLMTGDVLPERTTINVVDNADLQSIHAWLSPAHEYPSAELEEIPSKIPDQEICEKANARFFKFSALMRGEFEGNPSESDHALISMLCDLTSSNEQIRRIFSSSGLWNEEREKKKRDLASYVNRTIKKIRGKQIFNREKYLTPPAPQKEEVLEWGSRRKIDSLPDGLIKRTASWIWEQSRYPLQESAISAAFSLMSTVAGRNFQTHGSTPTGLNLWFILVAGTGTGKNEYQNGVSKVVKKVSDANKFGGNFFHLFGGKMVSGPAMEDALADSPRCFTYFPEFAGTYRDLTTAYAQPHHATLRDALLDVFMQSGEENYLQRRRKAKQKGEEVNTTAIQAPCLVLGGESTEKKLDECMSAGDLSGGFLQRFCVLYAEKSSVSRYSNPNNRIPMPQDLIDDWLELFVRCDELAASNEFIQIPADEEATKMLAEYDHIKRGLTLDGENDSVNELYNRSGIKVIRMASLLALSENRKNPTVNRQHVEWASAFVDDCDYKLLAKFKSGVIGSSQVKQETEILSVFKTYEKMSITARRKAGMSFEVAENPLIMPHLFLKKLVVMSSAFSESREAVTAFEKCLKHMEESGQIVKVPYDVAAEKYEGQRCWCVMR